MTGGWPLQVGCALACAVLLGVSTGCGDHATAEPDAAVGGSVSDAGAAGEPSPAGNGASGSGEGGAGAIASAGRGASDAGGGQPSGGVDGEGDAGGEASLPSTSVYAASVESFVPGAGAGYNEAKLPDIVLGPPQGKGTGSGTLDVLSLGAGGEIVLGFGERGIVDEPGPDLVVFENAFWPSGDKQMVFAELGEVSVSEDGETWLTFACDRAGDGEGNFPGCAGWTPTLVYDAAKLVPLDPEQSGGDAFDLADVGLERARFVKIHDLETLPPGGNTTGFDLDAVAAVHAK